MSDHTKYSDKDARYFGIVIEQILHELKVIHELVADQPTRSEFNELKDDVRSVKDDVHVLKAVATDQSRELKEHDRRIGRLEADAA